MLASINYDHLNQWLMILVGHLSATLVVFIASRIVNNSSLYDPFWSVAPIPIAIYLAFWPSSQLINIEKILLILDLNLDLQNMHLYQLEHMIQSGLWLKAM